MPLLGMLHFFIAIGFAVHCYKTGRPYFWIMVLLLVPLLGSIAYVMFELLPEMANTRRGRQVASDLRTAFDPDREWRERNEQVRLSDNVDAKLKFAAECERKGMWDEAVEMYRKAGQGIFADDPDIFRNLARAQMGGGDAEGAQATLEKLRTLHPAYQNQGRLQEAEVEYRALAGYYVGLEARTRYGLLLQKLGQPAAARPLFEDVVRVSRSRRIMLTPNDKDWLKVAQSNLI
jgi:hypothetical protein